MADGGTEKHSGQRAAFRDALLCAHYFDFCKVAGRVLNGDAATLKIEAADLAHEAVIRLSALERFDFNDRSHFLSLSAVLMRQIVIDETRKMRAAKRQPPPIYAQYSEELDHQPAALEGLDRALKKLAIIAPHCAKLVDQRYFLGLTTEEIAKIEHVSVRTIKRRWGLTRAWLSAELGAG